MGKLIPKTYSSRFINLAAGVLRIGCCFLLFILFNQQLSYAKTEFKPDDAKALYVDLFSEKNTPFSGMEIEGGTTVFGDIDNDGDLDLFLSGVWITDGSSIEFISRTYVNDGNGNFTEKSNSNLEGAGWGDAAFGDIDNDGDLDLVITGTTFGTDGKLAKTYLNDGNGNFTEKSNSLTGVQYSSVALGDIDNDGDMDLIISGQANPYDFNNLTVYLNDGSGLFTSIPDDLPSIFRGSVILGDVDNDGNLDLFITGHNDFDGRISSTYINDGAGNFSEKSNPITELERSSAAFGDIDNDGDLDLITSGNPPGSYQNRQTRIYTNDGDGNFSEADQQPFTGVVSGTVAFGDLNSDGSLDVINTGFSDDEIITERFMNDGSGNFTEVTGSLLNLAANSIAMGDVDQDGALDLIIAGNYTNNDELVKLYTNLSENSNTAPSAPGSLSAVQNGSEITLSWGTASDSETPSDGLSYNIFLKEDPEGDPPYLISPMAQEADGWRKLPAPGNQGQHNSYTFQTPELACGESTTYAFSVQAVDHNFEGGSFSDDYNFTVHPPEIVYVDQDATSGDNNGSSWENAYTDLHTALNNLSGCITEVWVAEGTYIPAGETNPFRLRENLSLLGGFDGTEDDLSDRNISDHPTILSGDVNGSETANPGDAHTILVIPAVTNGVTIDGFIIESGYADGGGTGNRTGAAIDTNGNNTISNTIFRDNHAMGDGSNGVGGAVINWGGELTFINTLFYNNSSTGGGGAISAENGTVQLINSILANNESAKGGAINFWAGNVVAINSIFYNNSGTNGNMNDDGGAGIGIAANSLFFNETSGNNGDLPPAINSGSGNLLNTNPVFVDEENGDYSLQSISLALNAGSNTPFGTGEPAEGITTDLAGNVRIFDGTPDPDVVDIGAYEFQGDSEALLRLTLTEGWRMLASPVAGQSYANMLEPLWTQGIDGADYSGGEPNVYVWNTNYEDNDQNCVFEYESNQNCSGWQVPSSADFGEAIPAGSGFLMYVFEDDEHGESNPSPFPKDVILSGAFHSGNVEPTVNQSEDGWTLVGNPYRLPIAFDEVLANPGTSGLTGAAYVYDLNATAIDPTGPIMDNGGAWRSIAGDYGDIPSGNIAPGQGFFVQTENLPATLMFSESNQTTTGEFYGKETERKDFVRLELRGESLYNSAWIRFSDQGSTTPTDGEALELQSFSADYAVLGTHKSDGTLMDIAHYPSGMPDLEIPLAVDATRSGKYTITATDLDLPAGMSLYLYDQKKEQSTEIADSSFAYSFTMDTNEPQKKVPTVEEILARGTSGPKKVTTVNSTRFVLLTSPKGHSSELPEEIVLGQNYPNPFNPSTVISYQLPVGSQVRLEVYDMLGRNVATLVNEQVAAGRHTVDFDASHLSSGVYLYRLQTGSQIMTRKLTVMK
ncbi:FG-GAP-like repeat-containing protein [Rhodohalobacter sp. 614A]|uniref:FG-GAP-like repeat-containing protein n=1 Tax=Rhodohalobacter sp. 614A TaxID=2908649 RepID=UPI001F2F7C7B|nr:FG-GAP-like repeat-containing protein [Rhodohalobacter sp. 614A]